jgi:hypothetical protein
MMILTTWNGGDYPVDLLQSSREGFAVRYGKHLRTGMDYGQAAAEFGECVMHSLACAGCLGYEDDDNEG